MAKQEAPGRAITEYKPRLPYHPALQEKMGISSGEWNVLVDTVFPAAKTAGAVALAVSYCRARHLDPLKRVVHIVPIWDKDRGCMVETVWPGIAEHRTTAARTGQYAGHDSVEFGPEIERTFPDGDGEITVRFPEWAQMTVYRIVQGERCAFPGPKVRWLETYASKKSDAPNSMWADRPYGMIEKCAESAALRGAFPEELGAEETEVEASGRNWHGRPAVDVNFQTTAAMPRAEAVIPQQIAQEKPAAPRAQPAKAFQEAQDEPEAIYEPQEAPKPQTQQQAAQEPTDDSGDSEAAIDLLEGWKYDLEACETPQQCVDLRRGKFATVPASLQSAVRKMIRGRQEALESQG